MLLQSYGCFKSFTLKENDENFLSFPEKLKFQGIQEKLTTKVTTVFKRAEVILDMGVQRVCRLLNTITKTTYKVFVIRVIFPDMLILLE